MMGFLALGGAFFFVGGVFLIDAFRRAPLMVVDEERGIFRPDPSDDRVCPASFDGAERGFFLPSVVEHAGLSCLTPAP